MKDVSQVVLDFLNILHCMAKKEIEKINLSLKNGIIKTFDLYKQ